MLGRFQIPRNGLKSSLDDLWGMFSHHRDKKNSKNFSFHQTEKNSEKKKRRIIFVSSDTASGGEESPLLYSSIRTKPYNVKPYMWGQCSYTWPFRYRQIPTAQINLSDNFEYKRITNSKINPQKKPNPGPSARKFTPSHRATRIPMKNFFSCLMSDRKNFTPSEVELIIFLGDRGWWDFDKTSRERRFKHFKLSRFVSRRS